MLPESSLKFLKALLTILKTEMTLRLFQSHMKSNSTKTDTWTILNNNIKFSSKAHLHSSL